MRRHVNKIWRPKLIQWLSLIIIIAVTIILEAQTLKKLRALIKNMMGGRRVG